MNSKPFCLAASLILCSAAAPSFATELWATDSGSRTAITLNQINIATGAVLSSNSIGSGLAFASVDDFASDPIREPSVIWAVRWSALVNQLLAIDPFQNQILSSIQLTSPTPIHSLAIDPTDGALYGGGGTSLYRIARDTGTATLVGAASTSLDKALGFDSTGNLYGISGTNALLAIDKTNGTTNTIAALSVSLEDLSANPDTGIMYSMGFGPQNYSLYQLDLASGAMTLVGPSLSRPSSLAFTARPSAIGDFNGDTIVDARDYTVWRKRLGLTYTPSDYDTWRAHFGESAAGNSFTPASIPEPSSILHLAVALFLAASQRGFRRATNSVRASSLVKSCFPPCAVCLAFLLLLFKTGSAAGALETARSADRFVDSMGANTHYGNAIYVGGNAYADRGIDAKLAELGIRHVRDHSWNDTALSIVDNLYATYGIRANFILGETSRSPAELVALLKAHPGYEAIEGLNEPDANTRSYNGFTDNPATNSYPATRAFQNDLYAAVKADPQTQAVTVLSPAMGSPSRSQYLSPISFDVAAMHSYPSAREPTFNLDTFIGHLASLRGTPPKPLMSTETGYYNNPVQFGWIPEHLAAKYLPRLYAEYFNRGIERTYLYELADQGPNTANREENFGLLRFDHSEKPAFTALKNLIDLVEEPGAAPFTPGPLDYTLSTSPSTLHHTLLEKSDGKFYLMLWQEVPVFNRTINNNQGAEITNAPLSITLTLNTDIAQARIFQPNNSSNPLATYSHPGAIALSVPDQILVVELTPAIPEPTSIALVLVGCLFAATPAPRRRLARAPFNGA